MGGTVKNGCDLGILSFCGHPLSFLKDDNATKCGIAGENRPTGAKFPMEIIDL